MNVKAKRTGTQVVTGKVRLSYPHLFEKWSNDEATTKKYQACFIISKDDKETVNAIKAAIEEAKELGKVKLGGKIPANLKQPLHDGDADKPDKAEFNNSYYINARTDRKPTVVGLTKDAVTGKPSELGEEEVYPGCYVRVSLNFYAFNNASKGIGAGLGNVQKIDDGERLGGGSSAEADFDFEDEEDFLD